MEPVSPASQPIFEITPQKQSNTYNYKHKSDRKEREREREGTSSLAAKRSKMIKRHAKTNTKLFFFGLLSNMMHINVHI